MKVESGRHAGYRRARGTQRGATAVEFALVLPVLAILLLGIMEFGYAFLMQSSLANAARIGVRDYSINYKNSGAQQTSIDIAKATLPDPTNVTAATFSATCTGGSSAPVTLTLTYRYHSLTGMFDALIGKNVTLTGKGTMLCGG